VEASDQGQVKVVLPEVCVTIWHFPFLWQFFVLLWCRSVTQGTFNEILERVIDDTTIELMVGIDLGSNLGEFQG